MLDRLLSRLNRAIADTTQRRAFELLRDRAGDLIITRHRAKPDDGLPGRTTAITYTLDLPGALHIQWNPDELLEPVEVLETGDGDRVISEILRQAIIAKAIAETTAGVHGYAPVASVTKGTVSVRHRQQSQ